MDTPTARGLLQGLVGDSPSAGNGSCITITPIYYGVKRSGILLAGSESPESRQLEPEEQREKQIETPSRTQNSSPIIRRLVTPQPFTKGRPERKSRFHAEAERQKKGPQKGDAFDQPPIARSVRVKLAAPVLPKAHPQPPKAVSLKAKAREEEIMVQPVGAAIQIPDLSPLADWAQAGEMLSQSESHPDLVHVTTSAADVDLGAHFRAKQHDNITPEFGFLVQRQDGTQQETEVHIATTLPRNIYALMLDHIKGGSYDSPKRQAPVQEPELGPKQLAFGSPSNEDSITQYGTPAFSVTASIDDFGTPIPELFTPNFLPADFSLSPAASQAGSSSSAIKPSSLAAIPLLLETSPAEKYRGMTDSDSGASLSDSSDDEEGRRAMLAADAMSAVKPKGGTKPVFDPEDSEFSEGDIHDPEEENAGVLPETPENLNLWTARNSDVPVVGWNTPGPQELRNAQHRDYFRSLQADEALKTPLPQNLMKLLEDKSAKPPLDPAQDKEELADSVEEAPQHGQQNVYQAPMPTPGPDISLIGQRVLPAAVLPQLGEGDWMRALNGLLQSKATPQPAKPGKISPSNKLSEQAAMPESEESELPDDAAKEGRAGQNQGILSAAFEESDQAGQRLSASSAEDLAFALPPVPDRLSIAGGPFEGVQLPEVEPDQIAAPLPYSPLAQDSDKESSSSAKNDIGSSADAECATNKQNQTLLPAIERQGSETATEELDAEGSIMSEADDAHTPIVTNDLEITQLTRTFSDLAPAMQPPEIFSFSSAPSFGIKDTVWSQASTPELGPPKLPDFFSRPVSASLLQPLESAGSVPDPASPAAAVLTSGSEESTSLAGPDKNSAVASHSTQDSDRVATPDVNGESSVEAAIELKSLSSGSVSSPVKKMTPEAERKSQTSAERNSSNLHDSPLQAVSASPAALKQDVLEPGLPLSRSTSLSLDDDLAIQNQEAADDRQDSALKQLWMVAAASAASAAKERMPRTVLNPTSEPVPQIASPQHPKMAKVTDHSVATGSQNLQNPSAVGDMPAELIATALHASPARSRMESAAEIKPEALPAIQTTRLHSERNSVVLESSDEHQSPPESAMSTETERAKLHLEVESKMDLLEAIIPACVPEAAGDAQAQDRLEAARELLRSIRQDQDACASEASQPVTGEAVASRQSVTAPVSSPTNIAASNLRLSPAKLITDKVTEDEGVEPAGTLSCQSIQSHCSAVPDTPASVNLNQISNETKSQGMSIQVPQAAELAPSPIPLANNAPSNAEADQPASLCLSPVTTAPPPCTPVTGIASTSSKGFATPKSNLQACNRQLDSALQSVATHFFTPASARTQPSPSAESPFAGDAWPSIMKRLRLMRKEMKDQGAAMFPSLVLESAPSTGLQDGNKSPAQVVSPSLDPPELAAEKLPVGLSLDRLFEEAAALEPECAAAVHNENADRTDSRNVSHPGSEEKVMNAGPLVRRKPEPRPWKAVTPAKPSFKDLPDWRDQLRKEEYMAIMMRLDKACSCPRTLPPHFAKDHNCYARLLDNAVRTEKNVLSLLPPGLVKAYRFHDHLGSGLSLVAGM